MYMYMYVNMHVCLMHDLWVASCMGELTSGGIHAHCLFISYHPKVTDRHVHVCPLQLLHVHVHVHVYTGLRSVYMYIVHVHEYSMYNQNLNIYGLANVLYM